MIITNQSNVQFSFTLPDGTTETQNVDSNIVTTEILTYSFTKVKSTNKLFLREGEQAEQTVVYTNNSQSTITNLFFKDVMTSGASNVVGTVTINGVSFPAHDVFTGFALPDMSPNDVTTVKYTILSNNPKTEDNVVNYANLDYAVNGTSFNENTNLVTIPLVSTRLTVVKQVDKAFAVKGDTLHYTSTVTNTGTLAKTNLIFTDTIPAGTTFVVGSVRVNGASQPAYNPQNGFALPNLNVGEVATVEFDVVVN